MPIHDERLVVREEHLEQARRYPVTVAEEAGSWVARTPEFPHVIGVGETQAAATAELVQNLAGQLVLVEQLAEGVTLNEFVTMQVDQIKGRIVARLQVYLDDWNQRYPTAEMVTQDLKFTPAYQGAYDDSPVTLSWSILTNDVDAEWMADMAQAIEQTEQISLDLWFHPHPAQYRRRVLAALREGPQIWVMLAAITRMSLARCREVVTILQQEGLVELEGEDAGVVHLVESNATSQ